MARSQCPEQLAVQLLSLVPQLKRPESCVPLIVACQYFLSAAQPALQSLSREPLRPLQSRRLSNAIQSLANATWQLAASSTSRLHTRKASRHRRSQFTRPTKLVAKSNALGTSAISRQTRSG